MRNVRQPIIWLCLLAWVTWSCTLTAPAHACCKASPDLQIKTALPCCTVQPATQPDGKSTAFGPDTDVAAGTAFARHFALPHALAADLGRLAQRHVHNQSNRHLELGVLLN